MRGKFISSFRPTPATVIAILALVIAMTGGAIAATNNKGPVTVFTSTGGPVTINGGQQAKDGILLTLASPNSFTQKAGQAALIAAELTDTRQSDWCDLLVDVRVHRPGDGEFGANILSVMDLANRGGTRAGPIDSGALAAPASNRTITLDAFVRLEQTNGDPAPEGPVSCPETDSFTLSLRVSIAQMPT